MDPRLGIYLGTTDPVSDMRQSLIQATMATKAQHIVKEQAFEAIRAKVSFILNILQSMSNCDPSEKEKLDQLRQQKDLEDKKYNDLLALYAAENAKYEELSDVSSRISVLCKVFADAGIIDMKDDAFLDRYIEWKFRIIGY